MIPFLAVTGAPTEAEVRAKVADIEAAGARSFMLYARSGLGVPYMGEEWLRLAEWFCDEASRRGMRVWLYDEYNWPSGTCKGRVPRENEAWRYRELCVFQKPGGGWLWREAVAPAGWVNACEPDAVRRFIELTHEVYAKRLAHFFDDGTVVGFFSDEPGYPVKIDYADEAPRVAFRLWSGMEEEYRAETGRDFRADVEAWLNGCAGVADLPAAYSRILGRRFRASYFDQIRAWCESRGVAFTGHMIEENSLVNSSRFNGDPMLCLRGENVPGIDEVLSNLDPCGATDPEGRQVEWITFNLARQAILHNGRGGCAELFACGPGDLPPGALRQMVWMCAFHGIDRYVTCMDVMDERGFVEKHGYISAAGSVHPWYESHAAVFAGECRLAAAFAAKRVVEREVGVRYPGSAAAAAAFAARPGWTWGAEAAAVPDANGLLRALETHQFVPRFVREDDPCGLALVFSCRIDGKYDEEKTGTSGIAADGAIALCRERLTASFRVLEADSGTEADDMMVRTCEDGTSAVVNMRPFSTRRLVAERGGRRAAFILPPHGVKVFAPGALPPDEPQVSEMHSLAAVKWTLGRDRPNLLRVNFTEDGSRKGMVAFTENVEATPVMRECAISYAITQSGRPVGTGEDAPADEKVIHHDAEPYAFAADGEPLAARPGACEGLLPAVFAPLYRASAKRLFGPGHHVFEIKRGEPDVNGFLPALWLVGDFRVCRDGALAVVMRDSEEASRRTPAAFGSFADLGYPHYVGAITWSATVAAPAGCGWRLCCETGGCLASVRFKGVELGVRAWAPFEWELPGSLAGESGELEITVFSSAQPMFGPHGVVYAEGGEPLWVGRRGLESRCGLFSASWIRQSEFSTSQPRKGATK